MRTIVRIVAGLLTVVLSACGGSGISSMPPPATAAIDRAALHAALDQATAHGALPIKHVVIIVQENRTLNSIFLGYPGAFTQSYGYMGSKRVPLLGEPLATMWGIDIDHLHVDSQAAYDNGRMDGFYREHTDNGSVVTGHAGKLPYAYVQRRFVEPYWEMARRFVLADRMFPTMASGSFTAHLDLLAGTTNLNSKEAVVDFPTGAPWDCEAPAQTTTYLLDDTGAIKPGPFPCFTQFSSITDRLDAANVSWKYYTPSLGNRGGPAWTEAYAFRHIYDTLPDAHKVVIPQTSVLMDAADGNLPAVSWVVPDFADSDHAMSESNTGPSWVAAVVNAIGHGPDWNSTAVVVVWDDWGGWYDPVAPPQLDFRGLGIRVPCLIISPYARRGYVSHTQYEFGSILKFTEQVFGLPEIGRTADGYTDTRANSILDSFDFTQSPRRFVHVPAPYPASYFLSRPASNKAPDPD